MAIKPVTGRFVTWPQARAAASGSSAHANRRQNVAPTTTRGQTALSGPAEALLEEIHSANLTPRERQVLELLDDGLGRDQIARRLLISPGTVATHVNNIRGKYLALEHNTAASDARTRGKAETTPSLDKEDLSAVLEIITGTGETEMLSLTVEMREYLDELRTQLEALVLPSVLARVAKGAAAISPSVLARRMLAVAPAPAPMNRMAEQVGPEFYDTNGVAAILAAPGSDPVSKQAVEQRRRRHTIVALPTAEGRWIYPTWQFDGNDVIAGLADVLAAFHTTAAAVATKRSETAVAPFSEWSIGTWLTTPRDGLGGRTAVDLLRGDLDKQGLDHLLTLARHTAVAWAA